MENDLKAYGKFKNGDELYKSYQLLEKKLGQQGHTLAKLQEQLGSIQPGTKMSAKVMDYDQDGNPIFNQALVEFVTDPDAFISKRASKAVLGEKPLGFYPEGHDKEGQPMSLYDYAMGIRSEMNLFHLASSENLPEIFKKDFQDRVWEKIESVERETGTKLSIAEAAKQVKNELATEEKVKAEGDKTIKTLKGNLTSPDNLASTGTKIDGSDKSPDDNIKDSIMNAPDAATL